MDSKIKKLVAGVALAGALTVGTAGVAVAAEGSAAPPYRPVGPGRAGRHPGCGAEIRKGAVKVVTETLGVSRQDLRAACRAARPSASTPPRWARTPRPWSTR